MTTSSRLLDRSFRTAALALAAALGARGAFAQDAGRAAPPAGEARAEKSAEGPTQEQADAAVKTLKEALASKEAVERVAALRAAADVPHADVAKAVAVALKDKDDNVEIAAMEALGKMRTPEGLKELQREATSDKKLRKDARLFSTLLKEIGRHGDPSSIGVLSENPWENTDTAVVRARIYGLGNIRDVKAVEALLEMMNKGNPLPGEDAPFMPDFRVALAHLTGTDQTTNKSMWQSWWNDNKKGFKVTDEQLAMPAELQAKWNEYWGLTPQPAPAPGQ